DSARSVPNVYQALALQLSVSGRNRVQVHPKISRHLANRRKLLALAQLAPRNQSLNLVNHLLVNRTMIILEINDDVHNTHPSTNCMVFLYTIQLYESRKFFVL